MVLKVRKRKKLDTHFVDLRPSLVVVESEGWLPNVIALDNRRAVYLPSLDHKGNTHINLCDVGWHVKVGSSLIFLGLSSEPKKKNPKTEDGAEPLGRVGVEELTVQVIRDAAAVLRLRHHVLHRDLRPSSGLPRAADLRCQRRLDPSPPSEGRSKAETAETGIAPVQRRSTVNRRRGVRLP